MGVSVAFVVALVSLVPAAVAHRPAGQKKQPRPLIFRVTLTISPGTWTSNYDCRCNHDIYGGIHTLGESDNHLHFHATYTDVKIPKKGAASIHLDASNWSAAGVFSMYETAWTSTDHDYPITCNGIFDKAGQAPVLSDVSPNNELDLHLHVQAGRAFKLANVSGTNCPKLSNGFPFWPVSSLSTAHVEGMFSVRVTDSLRELRSMKVGDVTGATVHQDKAVYEPPSRCADERGSGTCTESLHWTGHIKLERTG